MVHTPLLSPVIQYNLFIDFSKIKKIFWTWYLVGVFWTWMADLESQHLLRLEDLFETRIMVNTFWTFEIFSFSNSETIVNKIRSHDFIKGGFIKGFQRGSLWFMISCRFKWSFIVVRVSLRCSMRNMNEAYVKRVLDEKHKRNLYETYQKPVWDTWSNLNLSSIHIPTNKRRNLSAHPNSTGKWKNDFFFFISPPFLLVQ